MDWRFALLARQLMSIFTKNVPPMEDLVLTFGAGDGSTTEETEATEDAVLGGKIMAVFGAYEAAPEGRDDGGS